jgi:hypothetical protein
MSIDLRQESMSCDQYVMTLAVAERRKTGRKKGWKTDLVVLIQIHL